MVPEAWQGAIRRERSENEQAYGGGCEGCTAATSPAHLPVKCQPAAIRMMMATLPSPCNARRCSGEASETKVGIYMLTVPCGEP